MRILLTYHPPLVNKRTGKKTNKQEGKLKIVNFVKKADTNLKGHGNEADFLGFLHKSVWHRSLTLHFEPSDFGFEFSEIFVIEKPFSNL